MPGRDGTGPSGKGPFTGGAMGDCVVKIDQEDVNNIRGYNWNRSYSEFNRGYSARKMGSGCARKNRHGRGCY